MLLHKQIAFGIAYIIVWLGTWVWYNRSWWDGLQYLPLSCFTDLLNAVECWLPLLANHKKVSPDHYFNPTDFGSY